MNGQQNNNESNKDDIKIEYNNGIISIKYTLKSQNSIPPISVQPKVIIEVLKKQEIANIDDIVKTEKNNEITIYYFKTKVEFIGADYQEIKNLTDIPSKYELCKFSQSVIFNLINNFVCVFEDNVQIKFCKFEQDITFSQCVFKKNLTIYNCEFQSNANFGSARFEGNFVSNNVVYHQNVNFHNAFFENTPIFTASSFLNIQLVDFVNVKNHLIEFKQIKDFVKENFLNQTELINEIRDSYRAIKNTLIQQNNLLDASQWHKLELYTKEIELDSKKPNIFSRDGIDKIVLSFYRHTSDHHTDLLKILNNIMMLIALFGIFSLVLVLIATNENPPETLGIVSHIWDFSQVSNIQNQQKIFYVVGQIPASLEWNDYCGCKIWGEISFILGFCAFFILGFLGLLCLQKCVYIYRCVIGLSYLIVLVILAIKPALLLPIFGKLLDESLKVNFPAFTSLSIVYAILMFLLLFSLQKTARKNSIVPS